MRPLTGQTGLVAGWGKTDNSFGKTGTNILHKVTCCNQLLIITRIQYLDLYFDSERAEHIILNLSIFSVVRKLSFTFTFTGFGANNSKRWVHYLARGQEHYGPGKLTKCCDYRVFISMTIIPLHKGKEIEVERKTLPCFFSVWYVTCFCRRLESREVL